MFKFKFGNTRTRSQIASVAVVLSLLISGLSQCSGVSSERLWDLLDEIQRQLFPQGIINDVIIKDSDRVKKRVERDVTTAIRNYEILTNQTFEVKLPSPVWSQKSIDSSVCYTDACKALGGEMRLCAPFYEGCKL